MNVEGDAKLVNIHGPIVNCILTMDKNHLHCSKCSVTYCIIYWLKDNEGVDHENQMTLEKCTRWGSSNLFSLFQILANFPDILMRVYILCTCEPLCLLITGLNIWAPFLLILDDAPMSEISALTPMHPQRQRSVKDV